MAKFKPKMNQSRRRFIRGVLNGVPVFFSIPFLDQFVDGNGEALAQGGELPKFFGVYFWGLGRSLNNDYWNVKGSKENWTLNPQNLHGEPSGPLAVFKDLKDYMTMFQNFSYLTPRGAGHIPQQGLSLSASHDPKWVQSKVSGYRNRAYVGDSIDNIVAAEWAKAEKTYYGNLVFSLGHPGPYKGRSSWKNRQMVNSISNVVGLYSSIVGIQNQSGAQGDNSALKATSDFQRSVLDALKDDIKRFKKDLTPRDRERIEYHESLIRDTENKLAIMMEGTSCEGSFSGKKELDNLGKKANNLSLKQRNEWAAKLMAYGLSCGLTRVFNYELTPTQAGGQLNDIGLGDSKGLHDGYSHGNQPGMRKYCRYTTECFATFLTEINKVKFGDKSLLDQALVVGTSEYAQAHNHNGHPYLFFGKAGGKLKGNFLADAGAINNNRAGEVLLTALRAAGLSNQSIGMATTNSDDPQLGKTQNYTVSKVVNEVLT